MSRDAVTLTTLVIAVVSLVLSVASLTWQAVTFVLSGSRVHAGLRHGARRGNVVATGSPGSQSFEELAMQGFSEEIVGVRVRNVGRLAVQVTAINAALATGTRLGELRSSMGPELPHRLDAQSSADWYLLADPIRRMVEVSAAVNLGSDPCKVWMEVELGNGKTVRTRERLSISGKSS